MVWKSLFRANQNLKRKPIAQDLNPKAVTNDELFGVINPSTREWKDGECGISMYLYVVYSGGTSSATNYYSYIRKIVYIHARLLQEIFCELL